MVVDRSHAENTLPARLFKISHLDDHRQYLHKIDEADNREKQGHAHHKHRGRDKSAQGQRSRIPHKHLCRGYVKQQKTQQAPHHRSGDGTDPRVLPDGHNGQEGGHQNGHAGAQSIQAVGEIHAVVRAQHDKKQGWHKQDTQVQKLPVIKTAGEWDQHIRPHLAAVHHIPGENPRDHKLSHQLLHGL